MYEVFYGLLVGGYGTTEGREVWHNKRVSCLPVGVCDIINRVYITIGWVL